jgi:hypothetical protein
VHRDPYLSRQKLLASPLLVNPKRKALKRPRRINTQTPLPHTRRRQKRTAHPKTLKPRHIKTAVPDRELWLTTQKRVRHTPKRSVAPINIDKRETLRIL